MKIDTTKQPSIPSYLKSIESHDTSMGTIEWDKTKVSLHLEPEQKDGYIDGNILRDRMKGKGLNATVLDWLMDHPDQIPDEWKGKYVYFWGTIYRDSDDDLCVRYLYWYGGAWYWDCHWLDHGFDGRNPAALRASTLNSGTLASLTISPLTAAENIKKGDQVRVVGDKVMKVKVCSECKRPL